MFDLSTLFHTSHEYPYPVAKGLRRLHRARTGVDKAAAILETAHDSLHFLAALACADSASIKEPSTRLTQAVDVLVSGNSPCRWWEFLQEWAQAEGDTHLPELKNTVIGVGKGGETWVRAAESLDALFREPGLNRSVFLSASEHLSSDAVLNSLQTFIEGLGFFREFSLLTPRTTWREGNHGIAVATRAHGHTPLSQGMLVTRKDGRLHNSWPFLARHDSGLCLPLYPLIMEEEGGNGLRARVLFNKAESAPDTGATRERWWGDRSTEGLLKRLRSGEHEVFSIDSDTLLRLRLLEPQGDATRSHSIAAGRVHRTAITKEGEDYRVICGLSATASRNPESVSLFQENVEAIRTVGRGMLKVDPMSLRQDWNSVVATAHAGSPFGLEEVLEDEGPLNLNGALTLGDSILERVEEALEAGLQLETLSPAHFFVTKELTADFLPMPIGNEKSEGPVLEVLARILERTGQGDPGAFRGAVQALQNNNLDEELLHRVRIARAQLGQPDGGDVAASYAADRVMSALQIASPETVASRLKNLFQANPGEADVVEGLRVLAADTWPQDTRLTLLSQALSHPFATAVEGRDAEIADEILAMDPANAEASRVVEAALRSAKDWEVLAGKLLRRFSATHVKSEKRAILEGLSRIFEEEMDSNESAFLVYQKALEDDPTDTMALDGAIRIAEKAELWEELYNLYLHLIDNLEGKNRAGIELEAATLAAEQLGLYHKAIAHLEEVLKERGDDPGALMLFAHLLTEVKRDKDAIGAWETAVQYANKAERVICLTNAVQCAENAGEWHHCVRFLELRAVYEDRISAAHTCGQIAEICLDKLGDIGHADSALARAEALAPNDPEVKSAVREVANRSGEAIREATLEEIAAAGEDLDQRETALRRAIHAKDRIALTPEELVLFYRELIALAPSDLEPLHHFYELLLSLNEHEEADTVMEARIRYTNEPGRRSELLMERAQNLIKILERPLQAAELLREASELRPDDDQLAKAHVRALQEAQDNDGVISALKRRADMAHGNAKADLLVEVATLVAEEGETEGAHIEALEQALQAAPDHPTAAKLLSEHYVADGAVEKAIPLLTLWADAVTEAGNTEEAIFSWLRVSELSESIQLWERAIAACQKVRGIDQNVLEAWIREAEALTALGRNQEASAVYRSILNGESSKPKGAEEKKVQRALSTLAAQEGQTEESRQLLEATLSEDGGDEMSLATLVALCEAQSDWDAAVRYREMLIPVVSNSAEKAKLWLLQGRMLSNQLNHGEKAITALGEALLLNPESKVTLATLLETALRFGEYAKAVDTLDRLASLENDGDKKGHHLLAKGLLYRDHLHDELRAIGSLNNALDASPLLLEAFEALDAIHVKRMDFKAQAESYETMLSRVSDLGDTEALVFKLLMNLGSLHRKLGNMEKAIHTLERAKAIRPTDVEVHQKLARNLEESQDKEDEAIDAFFELLRHNPRHVEAYKALRRLFTRKKETDAAWCACGGLVTLNAADDKERAFYEAHVKGALKVSKPIRDDTMWTTLLYPMGMNAEVGILLDAVYQRHPEWFAADTLEGLGLDASTRIDLSVRGTFTNFARTVPKILGVTTPEYHESEAINGLRKASTERPTLVVPAPVFTATKGKRLRFQLGRALALFHPYHSVVGVRGASELQGLVDTLHALHHNPDTDLPLAQKLRGQMAEDELLLYAELAPGIFVDPAPPSVEDWLLGVEITASRAGLLLCNDLEVACHETDESPQTLGICNREVINNDLLRFCVSRDYHELRKKMGIALT